MESKTTPSKSKSTAIDDDLEEEGIDQFLLPQSIITRIMRESLPQGFKISKTSSEALQYASTVFINHLTVLALEKARLARRQNFSTADLYSAVAGMSWRSSDEAMRVLRNAQLTFEANKKSKAKAAKKPIAQVQVPPIPGQEPVSGGGGGGMEVVVSEEEVEEEEEAEEDGGGMEIDEEAELVGEGMEEGGGREVEE